MPTSAELSKQISDLISTRFTDFDLAHLPGLTLTPEALVELLVSVQFNPFTTTESAGKGVDDFHFETYRCTARLYCLSLVHKATAAQARGDTVAFKQCYQLFIEAQRSDAEKNPVLTEASFHELTSHLTRLSSAQQKALVINTIISSLVLTPAIKDKMHQLATDPSKYPDIRLSEAERAVLTGADVRSDSILFLKKVCGNPGLMKALYPFVDACGDEAIAYACKAFSAGHLRWYLYTEGNDAGAYDDFQAAVTSGLFTPDVVHSWFCYWLINIAGFRGHEKDAGWRGARYLNQNTFAAIHEFMYHLELFCKIPNYPILIEWLEARALKLQFTIKDPSERLFLAHLACLTRTYDALSGKYLEEGLNALAPELRAKIAASYRPQLSEGPSATFAGAGSRLFAATAVEATAYESVPVSTYLPQVFSNIENYVFKKIGDRVLAKSLSVQLGLQIYLSAWENYLNLRRSGAIDPKLPLSFNGLTTDLILDSLLVVRGEVQEVRLELKAAIRGAEFNVKVKRESGATQLELKVPEVELHATAAALAT